MRGGFTPLRRVLPESALPLQGDAIMTRKLSRRLRVIAARATVCAVMIAALGATGWRTQSDVDAAEASQAALFAH
jgi:hypothetical protein